MRGATGQLKSLKTLGYTEYTPSDIRGRIGENSGHSRSVSWQEIGSDHCWVGIYYAGNAKHSRQGCLWKRDIKYGA